MHANGTNDTEGRPQERAATFGGPGWQPRTATLAREVAEGRFWHHCGCQSEVGPLREVVIAWPGEEMVFKGSADHRLMLERPDLETLRRQAKSLAYLYASK